MSSIAEYGAALEGFRGDLTAPHDAEYDDRRALFNGMIDRRPALIARCADVADVQAALAYAREHDLPVAIRGGGHNGAGLGSVDDGVLIDLAGMRGVRVDPGGRTVRVEGGATLADVDHATHPFGVAVPGGIIASTGVGGLTLGGGIGHLTRGAGLTIDNLLEADVVLADGSLALASADENPDLFWALRGGGGNFGVVTSFLFRAHPAHTVVAGPMLWPAERAAEIMRAYRDFMATADRRLGGFFAFLVVPPADPFPEALRMQQVCGVVWCFNGPQAEADAALAPMRALEPILDGVMPMPLPVLQSAFDPLYNKGDQQYWRADFVSDLPDEAIARHVEHGTNLPTWQSTMHLYPIDGAAHDVGVGDTAWAARGARWAEVIYAVDPAPENAQQLRDWCVGYWDAVHPYAAPGAYVNFMMEEGADRVRATYGPNYDRLTRVKAQYDPDNVFHVNQNIPPAV